MTDPITLYNNSLIALTNCVRAKVEAGAHSRGSCRDPDKTCWFGQWCRDSERMDHVLEDLQENSAAVLETTEAVSVPCFVLTVLIER